MAMGSLGELRIVVSVTDKASKGLQNISNDTKKFTSITDALNNSLAKQSKKFDANSAAIGGMHKHFEKSLTANGKLIKSNNEMGNSLDDVGKKGKGLLRRFTEMRWVLVNFMLVAMSLKTAWKIGEWASEVDESMHKISAVTNETVGNIERDMLKLRSGTIFSLGDVSEAFFEVSKKGFDFKETTDIMNASMTLAVGGFTDLATATKLTTQVIKVFQLSSEEASNVVNSLNYIALNTAISIEDMATAFSYVAPIAHMAGISYQESASALGLLTDAGLQSTRASTSLRGVLSKLVNPSAEVEEIWKKAGVTFGDADGNVKTLSRAMRTLGSHLSTIGTKTEKLNFIMEMFGLRPAAGGTALLSIIEKETFAIDELTAASMMHKSAEESAAKMSESLSNRRAVALKKLGIEVLGFGQIMAKSWTSMVEGVSATFTLSGAQKALRDAVEDNKLTWKEWDAIMADFTVATTAKEKLEVLVKALEDLAEAQGESGDVTAKTALSWKDFDIELKKMLDTEKLHEKAIDNIIDSEAEAQDVVAGLNRAHQSYGNTLLKEDELSEIRFLAEMDRYEELAKKKEEYSKRAEDRETSERAPLVFEAAGEDIQIDLKGTESKIMSLEREYTELEKKYRDVAQAATDSGEVNKKLIDIYRQESDAILKIKDLEIIQLYNKESLASATDELSQREEKIRDATDAYNKELSINRDKLAIVKDEMSALNKVISESEKKISTLSKQRFTGETGILGLMDKLDIYIKKQQLADLGIADAQAFLQEQLARSGDGFDDLIAKQTESISLADQSKDAYNAWRESIETAIRSEIMAGEDLNTDVTDRVKTWQTKLLGIQAMSGGAGGETPEEAYTNKLKLAYDVYYGGLSNQVEQFNREEEDKANGVATSAEQIIGAIQAENVVLDDNNAKLQAKIVEETNLIENAKTLKEALETELEPLKKQAEYWQVIIDKINEAIKAKQLYTGKGTVVDRTKTSEGLAYTDATNKKLEEKKEENVTIKDIYNPWETVFNQTKGNNQSFDDFISRPGQPIAAISPQDTVVGTKNGGAGSTFNVNVNVSQSNASGDEIARAIKRELNSY